MSRDGLKTTRDVAFGVLCIFGAIAVLTGVFLALNVALEAIARVIGYGPTLLLLIGTLCFGTPAVVALTAHVLLKRSERRA